MHGRVCHGAVGFHEGTKKVLAAADYPGAAHARDAHRSDARICGRAIHLYVILKGLERRRL
jgi:hypothetical protein